MMEVEEAVASLIEASEIILKTRDIPLMESLNKILAEDIHAPIDVPTFPKSAMDGYAVKSEDFQGEMPKKLRVIDRVMAGDKSQKKEESGTAIRIMTGGFIPAGYDSVVKQEDTDYGEEEVTIYKKPRAYDFYCQVGEDIEKGELILKRGIQLKSLHLGILASLGLDKVKVYEDLRVTIIGTGSELLKPGEELLEGHIYGSSGYILASHIRGEGMELVSLDLVEDDKTSLEKILLEASEVSDLILTTGGVSVGERDLMPGLMEELGEVLFHRINMKPGTPVLASKLNGKLVLSFSGNPFASQVNFHVLFWPLVSHIYGSRDLDNKMSIREIGDGYMKPSSLRRYVRAKLDGDRVLLNQKDHKSSVISNLIYCDCMVVQEPGRILEKGDRVKVIHLKKS